MMMIINNKSVSFSGYRPEKMPDGGNESATPIIKLKTELNSAIRQAIADGFESFLVGMADGFDTYATLEVLSIKKEYPHLKLIAVVPFENATTKNETYTFIINNSNEVITLDDSYNRGAYLVRNEYLVNNSARLICYYDGLGGGTEYTVDYAHKKGIEVINLAPQKTTISSMPEMFDNITKTVRDDLDRSIRKGSKISIAGACFSIYAYNELKKRLNNIDELKFIFTSPTFVTDKLGKEKREFYIPRMAREKSLYGTEFEVKLRNELTQKAIAKECAK